MSSLTNTLLASEGTADLAHGRAVGEPARRADAESAPAQEVNASLHPRASQLIALGVNGPVGKSGEPVSSLVWDATYLVGMACGVWLGVYLAPYIATDFELAGGWLAVVCLLALQFLVACRALRPELRSGAFLHEKLSNTEVSRDTDSTVRSTIYVMWTVQLLCVVPIVCFWVSVLYEYWGKWGSTCNWSVSIGIFGFLQGVVAGSFRVVSLVLAVLSTTEVLRDRAIAVARRTETLLSSDLRVPPRLQTAHEAEEQTLSTQKETERSVLSDARNLGADLAVARKLLRPALVGSLTWSVACSILFAIVAVEQAPGCDRDVCHWPDGIFYGLSALHGAMTHPLPIVFDACASAVHVCFIRCVWFRRCRVLSTRLTD